MSKYILEKSRHMKMKNVRFNGVKIHLHSLFNLNQRFTNFTSELLGSRFWIPFLSCSDSAQPNQTTLHQSTPTRQLATVTRRLASMLQYSDTIMEWLLLPLDPDLEASLKTRLLVQELLVKSSLKVNESASNTVSRAQWNGRQRLFILLLGLTSSLRLEEGSTALVVGFGGGSTDEATAEVLSVLGAEGQDRENAELRTLGVADGRIALAH
ncbi:hypothetical protein GX50_05022 [[Emmonsia] crescens]|uniref:Uncharacterized protein n=1 Tax=[Emmonsia] crescens TaxID=73230 RepID=A0A2B7ZG76_9EURO|nr:hypothetical protein GX50_05022 [Emmonsia crescens]